MVTWQPRTSLALFSTAGSPLGGSLSAWHHGRRALTVVGVKYHKTRRHRFLRESTLIPLYNPLRGRCSSSRMSRSPKELLADRTSITACLPMSPLGCPSSILVPCTPDESQLNGHRLVLSITPGFAGGCLITGQAGSSVPA